MMLDSASELAHFGVGKSELLFLRPDSHTVAPYLDLLPSMRRSAGADDVWPEAIVCGPFGPLAYVVRNDQLDLDTTRRHEQLRRLQSCLASRSDAPMLVVVNSRRIEVFSLGAGYSTFPATTVIAHRPGQTFFRELATGALPTPLIGAPGWRATDRSVAGSIAMMVVGAVRRLRRAKPDEALLLIIRAITIRVLLERGLAPPLVRQELFEKPFTTYEAALRSNKWLDDHFDGKILRSDWWWPNAALEQIYDYARIDRHEMVKTLTDIFIPSDTVGLNWSNIDFAHVRPILLAEAFDRAVAELKLPADTRCVLRYTPAVLAKFIAEEAIASNGTVQPRVLITSSDCGQLLIATLEQVVMRKWAADGRRPSRTEIEQLIASKLHANGADTLRTQIGAATLSMAALDFAAETFPLSSGKFESPLNTVFATTVPEQRLDIVIGDHANDRDQGLKAIGDALAATDPHGTVALCVGHRVVRIPARRLPTMFRSSLRLTGIAANLVRAGRKKPVDVVFARNEAPTSRSEFWVSLPFCHRHAILDTPFWIDAARSQPVSQALAEEVPGLLAALPAMNILEAGVLAKVWRKLTTPLDALELDDPGLTKFCGELVSESVVGRFIRTVLCGVPTACCISLPTIGFRGLPEAIRIEAGKLSSNETSDEGRRINFISQLCGLDSTDLAIMSARVEAPSGQTLVPRDFAHAIEKWLKPFSLDGDIHVEPFNEEGGKQAFHILAVRSHSTDFGDMIDPGDGYECIANEPVASIGVVRLDGDLLIWVTDERLDSTTAWITALNILRNHAVALDGEGLWPND